MSVRTRIAALERRSSPTGECACGTGIEMLLCRDPSVPLPPPTVCPRCARPRRRVILGPVPKPGSPPYEPLSGLRDYYERTVQTAYGPADGDTIVALMNPAGFAP